MQQQQNQSTPLPHRGLLSQKLQRLQDLLLLVPTPIIVVNSMLVVHGPKAGISTLMDGKREVLYSLTTWDIGLLTTAVPVLL